MYQRRIQSKVQHATASYILVHKALQEFELSIGPLSEGRTTKRLHDFFDSDILAGDLISCRTAGNPH